MHFAGLDDSLIPLLIFGLPLLIRLFKGKDKKKAKQTRSVDGRVKGELAKVSRSLRQVSSELNKAAGGSRPKDEVRQGSRAPVKPAAAKPDGAKEELPAWLSNLVEEIGGTVIKEEPTPRAEIEVMDVNPVGVEEAKPVPAPSAPTPAPKPRKEVPVQGRTTVDAADYHVKARIKGGKSKLLGAVHDRSDWRRAIVLSEILDKPRAMRGWRDLESTI